MRTQIQTGVTPSATLPWREDYWELVLKRDRIADGQFYYSVASTGVYCRPSCPARLANPENVRFHASCADAERAGFRPCKRCKPNGMSLAEEHSAKVARACRVIEGSDDPPCLDELGREVGMTPFHLHKIFKQVTGLTPKAYAAAQRSQRVRSRLLAGSGTVTEAIYGAGYNSSGRFYDHSGAILGMRPSNFRSGGENENIKFAVGQCSLGAILVARSEVGICAISLGEDREALLRELHAQFPRARLTGADSEFEDTVGKVVALVDSPEMGFHLPLDIRGTAFQQRVWKALTTIPMGSRLSYAELARRIGSPQSVRAVAQACGANRLAVAIPCHRVVRQDGDLAGYRWGIDRKRRLLEKETES